MQSEGLRRKLLLLYKMHKGRPFYSMAFDKHFPRAYHAPGSVQVHQGRLGVSRRNLQCGEVKGKRTPTTQYLSL